MEQWHRLDRDLLARVQAIDPVIADTFSRHSTQARTEPLPFYGTFKLLRIRVELPHRPMGFRFADDGRQLIALTGRATDVYRVNDAAGLTLVAEHVASYARFFLRNVAAEGGHTPRFLAETADDVFWLPDTEVEPSLRAGRSQASARLRPLDVSGEPGRHRVVATVIESRRLNEVVLIIERDGHVSSLDATTLLDDLPVFQAL